MTADHDLFDLGDFVLQDGTVLPKAKLAFKTYGTLNASGTNAIVYPTAYSGFLIDNASRIGAGRALDPDRWFIVTMALFGNGQSSSPSNTPAPFDGPRFPPVTIADNVRAQHRLVTERFGLTRLALVTGFSMGGLQTYEWAAAHPDMVERIAPIAGAARCSRHNYVFLASLKAALAADAAFNGGDYTDAPVRGLKAFGRIYAGWALSQDFYRADLHRTALGAPDLDTFLRTDWEERFARRPAADLYAQLCTWDAGDISRDPRFDGDLTRALGAITARLLLMPAETDLYFRVADNAAELPALRDAILRPIPSIWGHRAGNPSTNPADAAFLRDTVRAFLGSSEDI